MGTSFNAGVFAKLFLVAVIPLVAFSGVSMLASEEIQKFIGPPSAVSPADGIHIAGIDMTDKSRQEMDHAINQAVSKIDQETISLIVAGEEWKIPVKDLEVKYKIPETIESFYNLSKQSSRSDLPLIFDYNEDRLNQYLEVIGREYNVDVQSARVILNDQDEVELLAGSIGIDFNLDNGREAVKGLIAGGLRQDTIDLSLTEIMPRISMNDIRDINKHFASFSTVPDPSMPNRTQNIKRSVELIEARVIDPGQEISITELMGPYTEANGYIAAPIIKGNIFEDGIGGGVCQVSSTIFIASMKAGLDIVEHHHHSMPVSYIPIGYDATLSEDGREDLVITNNLSKSVYISLAYDDADNRLVVDIFGNDKDYQAIYLETRNMTNHKYETIYQLDEKLAPYGEEILENGIEGITVDLYRIYQRDGKQEEQLLTRYAYPTYPMIINIGEKHFKNGQASDSTDQTENKNSGHLG